jgi:hypothetical protein
VRPYRDMETLYKQCLDEHGTMSAERFYRAAKDTGLMIFQPAKSTSLSLSAPKYERLCLVHWDVGMWVLNLAFPIPDPVSAVLAFRSPSLCIKP